jgi:virulence-associated protein VapD
MYAIVFDLDQDTLEKTYHGPSHTDAHGDIRKTLEGHGFTSQQGSVYFGDVGKVDAVACVLAVMELTRQHPWFAPSVKDIRMLRIEDSSDLMPAVKKAIGQ